jgi:hypothetical protein
MSQINHNYVQYCTNLCGILVLSIGHIYITYKLGEDHNANMATGLQSI